MRGDTKFPCSWLLQLAVSCRGIAVELLPLENISAGVWQHRTGIKITEKINPTTSHRHLFVSPRRVAE